MPHAAPLLRTQELTKKYGDFTAVDRLSIELRRGEIYGLLGPNGAGKTTAVRILTTLSAADGGRAEVAGHDVAREPAAVKRRIEGWD